MALRQHILSKNRAALKVLHENCHSLGYEDCSEIFPYDVKRAIAAISKQDIARYHIYGSTLCPRSRSSHHSTLAEFHLLKPDGIIVVEHLTVNQLPIY